jgi:hypothetical protein
MREASARVNLLLMKSGDLLSRARAIEDSNRTDATEDIDDTASKDLINDVQQSLREKLAEALVKISCIVLYLLRILKIVYILIFKGCHQRARSLDPRCSHEQTSYLFGQMGRRF